MCTGAAYLRTVARRKRPTYTVIATNHRSFWAVTVEGIPHETTAERHSLIGPRAAALILRHTGLAPGQYDWTVEYNLWGKRRAG